MFVIHELKQVSLISKKFSCFFSHKLMLLKRHRHEILRAPRKKKKIGR
jgi:hypothetical protein